MRTDSRLSRMLHVLLHMSGHEGAATSETIAAMLGTNPVVVRRTMAGLRDAGYVRSEKGHGGGWVLARPLGEITMLDVYRAVGEPRLFSLGLSNDNPDCLVERAVGDRLGATLRDAEERVLREFGEVTLADLAADFAQHRAACTRSG